MTNEKKFWNVFGSVETNNNALRLLRNMKDLFIITAVTLAVGIFVSNIAGAEKEPKKGESSALRAALVNFATALHDADKDKLLSCVTGDVAQLNGVAALVRYGNTTREFRRTFLKTYGEKAWDAFQKPSVPGTHCDATLTFPDKSLVKAAQSAEIRNVDGGYEATLPGSPIPISFVREGDTWKISATSIVPTGQDPGQFAKHFTTLSDLIEKYTRVIGKNGVTPNDIDHDLGCSLAEAALGIQIDEEKRLSPDLFKN